MTNLQNRQELPTLSQVKLFEIVNKAPEQLTATEIGYLKARRDCLDKKEIKKFKDILNQETLVVETKEVPDQDITPNTPNTPETNTATGPSLNWKVKKLVKYALNLGIAEADLEGKQKKDIIELINQAQANQ